MEYTNLIITTPFNNGEEGYGVKSRLKRRKEYGIRILIDPYQPVSRVNFLYRKDPNNVYFDIPCVCGIYSDEKHP